MDTIALYQSGIENVAASLGTALTENQAKLIKRYTKDVVLSYDADNAGRSAALRGLEILRKEDCKVKVLHVTDGKDPDEYVRKNGKQAFLKLINEALAYGDYRLESAKIGFDLSKDEDKIEYIKTATEIIRDMRPVEQEIYIKKVSSDLKIAEGAIKMELLGNDITEKPKPAYHHQDTEEVITEISPMEQTILKVMLTEESYIYRISDFPDILRSDFSKEIYRTIVSEYEQNHFIDINKIMDNLSQGDALRLQKIVDQVIIGGNEEQVFDECIKTYRDSVLAKEEERLITLLSMIDENDNQDKITELTDQLMKVQKERKNQQ